MYNDERSKKAMDGITHPLRSRREIDTFEVRSEDEQVLERIDRQEAEVFYSINQEEESTSNSPETQLIPDYKRPAAPQILKLSFKDGNKWVFSDGSGGTINADITDNSFWEKLNNRELSFGKGDTLKVEMLTKTSEKGGKLHTVHTITKVEKIIPPEQLKLFPQ
jgi:hypothetical protein